jgi:hypothetical protein
MNTYEIPVLWEASGYVRVEAESIEQAIQLAKDCDLPEDHEYIDGSFEVNIDCMADTEPDYWVVDKLVHCPNYYNPPNHE